MSSFTQNEPLIVRGAIVAAVTGIIHTLVMLGYLPINEDVEAQLAVTLDLVATAIFVVWGRSAVTPVAKGSSEEVIRRAPEESNEYTESNTSF